MGHSLLRAGHDFFGEQSFPAGSEVGAEPVEARLGSKEGILGGVERAFDLAVRSLSFFEQSRPPSAGGLRIITVHRGQMAELFLQRVNPHSIVG